MRNDRGFPEEVSFSRGFEASIRVFLVCEERFDTYGQVADASEDSGRGEVPKLWDSEGLTTHSQDAGDNYKWASGHTVTSVRHNRNR